MNKLRFLLLAVVIGIFANQAVVIAAEPEGATWTLTELLGKPLAGSAKTRGTPTLQLDAAKKSASGHTGVNRFFGSYEKSGEKLKFGALGSTEMGGPPEAMKLESSFLGMLGSVRRWQVADGVLTLLSEGQVVARFAVLAAAEK